jgi:hypothetical protein
MAKSQSWRASTGDCCHNGNNWIPQSEGQESKLFAILAKTHFGKVCRKRERHQLPVASYGTALNAAGSAVKASAPIAAHWVFANLAIIPLWSVQPHHSAPLAHPEAHHSAPFSGVNSCWSERKRAILELFPSPSFTDLLAEKSDAKP